MAVTKQLSRWFKRNIAYKMGFDVVPFPNGRPSNYPVDFEPHIRDICIAVRPYTMTPPERVYNLCKSVEYLVKNQIPGAFVECGVWRGGSMMAALLMLKHLGATDRDIYMFDTYEGMAKPTDVDVSCTGVPAVEYWPQHVKEGYVDWCYASIEDVTANVASTGYPMERIHFVKGYVEDTIPSGAPGAIALLRLDTDFYESTKHELEHLYPRLVSKGSIIIDDYGWWAGSQKATDEYFANHNVPIFLARTDASARFGIKP